MLNTRHSSLYISEISEAEGKEIIAPPGLSHQAAITHQASAQQRSRERNEKRSYAQRRTVPLDRAPTPLNHTHTR